MVREALPMVQEVLPVVREAHPEVWERLGGPTSGRGREAVPKVWEGREVLLEVRD